MGCSPVSITSKKSLSLRKLNAIVLNKSIFVILQTNIKVMNSRIEKVLNDQLQKEATSSQYYLAMASWAEANGLNGISQFMYTHSDEERFHMLKLVKFINERGGRALIPKIDQPPSDFKSIQKMFESLLSHEIKVTQSINDVVDVCLSEKDYTTHNFMQWYVSEQLEEEALARSILDKLKLIGADQGGMYIFDRDMGQLVVDQDPKKNEPK